jgi:hypothetical protein
LAVSLTADIDKVIGPCSLCGYKESEQEEDEEETDELLATSRDLALFSNHPIGFSENPFHLNHYFVSEH